MRYLYLGFIITLFHTGTFAQLKSSETFIRLGLRSAPQSTSTTYAITSVASNGGSINPSAAVVDSAANQSFAITASSGYQWDSLLVDDVSVTVSSPYTFTNVTATHTIRAVFSLTSGGIYIVSSGGDSLKSSGGDYLILP